MAVDAPTRALLELALASGQPRFPDMTPAEARELVRARSLARPRHPEVREVRDGHVAGVPVRWVVPDGEPTCVVCYLHPGGWVMGGRDDSENPARLLSRESGALVCIVDYRLAPEHPFPAALDDSWAVLDGLVEAARVVGGTTLPLVVVGESAGGNLGAVVTQRAAAAGSPAVVQQVLLYPVVDCDLTRSSYHADDNQLILDRETMAWFWDHYRPQDLERTSPELCPLRASSLAGLPPTIVVVAEHDVLRDEGEAYADRLHQAGVDVQLVHAAGQMHGFMSLPDVLPAAARSWQAVGRAVREATTSASGRGVQPDQEIRGER
jgi:acetyl esterase